MPNCTAGCHGRDTHVGHVPHMEAPERFNRELAELTRRVDAGVSPAIQD